MQYYRVCEDRFAFVLFMLESSLSSAGCKASTANLVERLTSVDAWVHCRLFMHYSVLSKIELRWEEYLVYNDYWATPTLHPVSYTVRDKGGEFRSLIDKVMLIIYSLQYGGSSISIALERSTSKPDLFTYQNSCLY